jgi:4-hydroxy-tetrahydrodipicolinate synthase
MLVSLQLLTLTLLPLRPTVLCISLDHASSFAPTGYQRVLRSSLSMALKPVVGGSVVALVTPMTAENKIDLPKFIDLLKWHVQEGTDGAVILGTTGEASTISLEERTEIIKTAVQTVNKAFPIIVGAGTIDPVTTTLLCQNALDCGADASLVITPYYVKPPQRALVQVPHY